MLYVERLRFQDNVKEIEMTVEQRHHKHFVARRCETLHQIEEEFAGVTISFPRSGVTSDRVVIKVRFLTDSILSIIFTTNIISMYCSAYTSQGPPDMIEATRQRIIDIVKDLEERVTINCEISQLNHRAVMGTKGSKVQYIEQQFDVKIKFPERNRGGSCHFAVPSGQFNEFQYHK